MAQSAQFYLLHDMASPNGLSAQEQLACNLAAAAWRLGKRVLISCEITTYATPIEISWSSKRNAQRRDLLINLQQVLPEFFGTFNQIIDFVPAEEQAKKLARERYKFLRTQGWQLSTENAA